MVSLIKTNNVVYPNHIKCNKMFSLLWTKIWRKKSLKLCHQKDWLSGGLNTAKKDNYFCNNLGRSHLILLPIIINHKSCYLSTAAYVMFFFLFCFPNIVVTYVPYLQSLIPFDRFPTWKTYASVSLRAFCNLFKEIPVILKKLRPKLL